MESTARSKRWTRVSALICAWTGLSSASALLVAESMATGAAGAAGDEGDGGGAGSGVGMLNSTDLEAFELPEYSAGGICSGIGMFSGTCVLGARTSETELAVNVEVGVVTGGCEFAGPDEGSDKGVAHWGAGAFASPTEGTFACPDGTPFVPRSSFGPLVDMEAG